MKTRTLLIAALVFAMGLLIGSASSFAQDQGQLPAATAQWWQSMLSIPASVNPIADLTGASCMIGQRDPLWLLAGAFSGKISRTCTIPAGEAVLIPVINNVQMNTPNICGQGPANVTVDDLRAAVAPYIDAVTARSATFDGQSLVVTRVKSNPFPATLPADNIYNQACIDAGLGPQPAGVFSPSVDDGYYALLPPLTAGTHTLRTHAVVPSHHVTLDVTYHLTVVPSPQ